MEVDKYLFTALLRILERKHILNDEQIINEIKAIKREERRLVEKYALKTILNKEELKVVKEIVKQRLKFGPQGWISGMFHDTVLKPLSKRLDKADTTLELGMDKDDVIRDIELVYDIISDHKRVCNLHGVEYTPKPIIKTIKKKLSSALRRLENINSSKLSSKVLLFVSSPLV